MGTTFVAQLLLILIIKESNGLPTSPTNITSEDPDVIKASVLPQAFSKKSHDEPRFIPKSYVIPNNQPFAYMDARNSFEQLTEEEQLYAHYLSK